MNGRLYEKAVTDRNDMRRREQERETYTERQSERVALTHQRAHYLCGRKLELCEGEHTTVQGEKIPDSAAECHLPMCRWLTITGQGEGQYKHAIRRR